jgi:transposase InsO family protein
MDFVADQLADGRRFRSLTVVDSYAREYWAIESEQGLKDKDVVKVVNRNKTQRGVPKMLYRDNGNKFSSRAMNLWLIGTECESHFLLRASRRTMLPWNRSTRRSRQNVWMPSGSRR